MASHVVGLVCAYPKGIISGPVNILVQHTDRLVVPGVFDPFIPYHLYVQGGGSVSVHPIEPVLCNVDTHVAVEMPVRWFRRMQRNSSDTFIVPLDNLLGKTLYIGPSGGRFTLFSSWKLAAEWLGTLRSWVDTFDPILGWATCADGYENVSYDALVDAGCTPWEDV